MFSQCTVVKLLKYFLITFSAKFAWFGLMSDCASFRFLVILIMLAVDIKVVGMFSRAKVHKTAISVMSSP